MAHERIAYECFAYLWGTAVLWEDASGIKMPVESKSRMIVSVVGCVIDKRLSGG